MRKKLIYLCAIIVLTTSFCYPQDAVGNMSIHKPIENGKDRKIRLKRLAKKADKSFNKKYKKELNQLTGLSKKEKKSVTPRTYNGKNNR